MTDTFVFTDLQTLARALGGVVSGDDVLAPGPDHKSPTDRSLSVKLDANAPDGFVVFSFSGDDVNLCRDYVRQKSGLPAFKPNGGSRQRIPDDVIEKAVMAAAAAQTRSSEPGRIVATYSYVDIDGKLLYQVVRLDPKDFRQRRPDGNGGWIWKLDERRVLYRWSELLKYPDGTVFACEGEKDADRVAELGHCATTVAHGLWTPECIKALAGRDVVILEDNDDAGRVKALAAAKALHGTAKTIRVVSLPNLPEKGDISDWLNTDQARAEKFVDVCFAVSEWAPTNTTTGSSWKYYNDEKPTAPRWLIKSILPENGAGILSGMWGTFKTTVALDMSICVMADLPFASRYKIKRRGAVLYFALEGEGAVPARLSAIAGHHGITGPLPFAWRGNCPPLVDKNSTDLLCGIANEAASDLDKKFSLPVSLIWLDTMITAAGYASGEDNDTAASQKVMAVLRSLSQRTGALVMGVDHFGKVIETGTRGSSAKEGAADVVIVLLADRELSGGVKNTRLAVRKQRDGMSGLEMPFTVKAAETGTDEDEPITAPVINWQEAEKPAQGDGRWTPSMQLLRRILMTTLADTGKNVRPFPNGPLVCACDIEMVRTEFYRQYPADGTDKQKNEARRKAFTRSLNTSVSRAVITVREVDGAQLIWLAKLETSNA